MAKKKKPGTGFESIDLQLMGKLLFLVGFILVICSATSLMIPQFLIINNALFIGLGLVLISIYMTLFMPKK